jgi:hypothetical protein
MSRRIGNPVSLGLAVLVALLTVGAGTAAAQNVPNSWQLTAFGGGYFGGQIWEGHDGVVDVGTAPTYGARLGYNFNRAIGVEVGWSQAKPNLNLGGYYCCGMGNSGKIGTLTVNTYEADVLFSYGSRKASGYFAVGLGATSLSPKISGVSTSTDTRFTSNVGLGGIFSLGPQVALRVDGRWRFVDTENTTGAGGWCDYYYGCYYYTTTWYSSGEITGGVLFRF